MKSILNQQIINKYILAEFGEIPNPINRDEMIYLINNNKLTLEKVKLWLLFGGDLMIKDKYDNNILHSASRMGQLDIVEFIIKKIRNIDRLNTNEETALLLASCRGHIKVINILLDNGANINYLKFGKWSILHSATYWNQLESVKILIDRGINIRYDNDMNQTALDVAKSCDYQEIIDYLTPFYNK